MESTWKVCARKYVSRVFVLFQFTRDKLVEIRRPKSVDVTESKEETGKRKMEELHRNLYFTRVSWCSVQNMENTATSDDLFIERRYLLSNGTR